MIVYARFPQQRPRARANAVHVSLKIAEIRSLAIARDEDGSSHALGGLIGPVDTPGAGIERVDRSVCAADKHASSENSGGSKCGSDSGESERPLHLQPRHTRAG